MKVRLFFSLLVVTAAITCTTASAQGTAFTYQGHLNEGGNPANGSYDFTFAICDALAGGNHIGNPLTNSAVAVKNGLFTVTLDFNGLFTGSNYWLELAVRTNGGSSFTTLAPRQAVTPTPYAIMAASASNLLGTVPNASLPANPNITGTLTAGSFSGNGSGLTNLNVTQLSGPLLAAQLPTNVAYTTSNQTFTGQNVFLGNVRVGSNGTNYALNSPESLHIVRGVVYGNGTVVVGSGYSVVRNSIGTFTIYFSAPFTNLPAVTVTPQAPGYTVTMDGWSTNYASVEFYAGSTLSDPTYFNFIAIGPP